MAAPGSLITSETLAPTAELTPELVHSALLGLSDKEALDTCVELLSTGRINDVVLARAVVELGQARGEEEVRRLEQSVKEVLEETGTSSTGVDLATIGTDQLDPAISKVLRVYNASAESQNALSVIKSYVRLEELRRRIDTFKTIWPSPSPGDDESAVGAEKEGKDEDEPDGMDLDDPWAEAESEAQGTKEEEIPVVEDPWEEAQSSGSAGSEAGMREEKTPSRPKSPASVRTLSDDPPFDLDVFLSHPLTELASDLASQVYLKALRTLFQRHSREIWPYRFKILGDIPAWTNPQDLDEADLLPRLGDDGKEERVFSQAPISSFMDGLLQHLEADSSPDGVDELLGPDAMTQWYRDRVDSVDEYGLIDIQLAWIQHGASRGIPDLDALGEELSLLSRLVYDSALSPAQQARWNLSTWREAAEDDIIDAYISSSRPDTIVADIRRLVLPYLFVLESRAERAGTADPRLVETRLNDLILNLELPLALPVFEASKATLPAPQRLVKNDMTVARLALACLYGSNHTGVWSTMSSIFECLPVWVVNGDDRDPESDQELTATTLESIAAFVRPSKAGDPPPTPKDLYLFFSPLPFASLSRALDILDVHLESGEILLRWDTPVQLRFLLQSARHKGDQLELAERMVRRQAARGPHTDARWTALWAAMINLNGGSDALLRGAFGQLGVEEMMKIYLGGVLSSGSFDIAKRAIRRLENEHGLSKAVIEDVCLTTSREFYDNAETGNLHTGNMKLAYDCLSVAPISPVVSAQRDFIEATSRLATFSLPSPSGSGTITPLEIRNAKSKLDLLRQVLKFSPDSYQHPELILGLAEKLGYRDDVGARIEVLGMLVDAAVNGSDYETAWLHCQETVTLFSKHSRKNEHQRSGSELKGNGHTKEVVWKGCHLVGSQIDFADIDKKMTLLGQAVELCPPDQVPHVLETWRTVEAGLIRLDEAAKRRRLTGVRGPSTKRPDSRTGSNFASPVFPFGEERMLGSRRAARAARLALDLAGDRFKFGTGVLGGVVTPRTASSPGRSPSLRSAALGSGGSEDGRWSNESDRPSIGALLEGHGLGVGQGVAEAERVRQQARKALVRGMGWLLGADENEPQS